MEEPTWKQQLKMIDLITNEVWLVKGYYASCTFFLDNGKYVQKHIEIPELLKKYFLALPNLKKRPFKFYIDDREQNQHFIKITSTGRFLESKRKGTAKLTIEIIGNLDVLLMIDNFRGGK